MNPGDVREKTEKELIKMAGELEEEVFRLKFRLGAGQLKQTANVKVARRNLARVLTIMREKQHVKEAKKEDSK